MKNSTAPSGRTLLVDHSILRKKIREIQIKIFLCGPGVGHHKYTLREQIKADFDKLGNIETRYGEDLEAMKIAKAHIGRSSDVTAQPGASADWPRRVSRMAW
jgi:hypothetical protein